MVHIEKGFGTTEVGNGIHPPFSNEYVYRIERFNTDAEAIEVSIRDAQKPWQERRHNNYKAKRRK